MFHLYKLDKQGPSARSGLPFGIPTKKLMNAHFHFELKSCLTFFFIILQNVIVPGFCIHVVPLQLNRYNQC